VAKQDPVASKKEPAKEDSKKKQEATSDKAATKNGEKPGGPLKGKLWKKGADGIVKKTVERIFVLEGTALLYYKSESDINKKKSKKIEIKGAKITAGKEEKTKHWINITTAQKKKREIAASSKEEYDRWFAGLNETAAPDAKADDKPAVIAPNPLSPKKKADEKKKLRRRTTLKKIKKTPKRMTKKTLKMTKKTPKRMTRRTPKTTKKTLRRRRT